jgi:CMP-N-acetylneuraminic acid synthetase
MKIVAFVPIKLNNRRLPNKNLLKVFDNKSILELMLERLESLYKKKIIDKAFVFSSSESLEEIVHSYEGCIFLKRPDSLDKDYTTSNEIVKEFIRNIPADVYVLCHATSPFIREKTFIDCINAVVVDSYDSAFLAKRIYGLTWFNNSPLNFDIEKIPRTQDLNCVDIEISTPYVFKYDVARDSGTRYSKNVYIHQSSSYEDVDIDTVDDLDYAVYIYNKKIKDIYDE